jgi:hypothetical protein
MDGSILDRVDLNYKKSWRYQGVIKIRKSKNRQYNGQKKKKQKDKQWSTKHNHKTKDRVTWTPLKTGGDLRCSGRVSSSCSTSDTRRVNLVINPVIGHEWGKNPEVFATSGAYSWSFVTQIFHSGQPSHGDDRTTFAVMTSTLGSVASLLAATIYQENPDRNHKLWNITF